MSQPAGTTVAARTSLAMVMVAAVASGVADLGREGENREGEWTRLNPRASGTVLYLPGSSDGRRVAIPGHGRAPSAQEASVNRGRSWGGGLGRCGGLRPRENKWVGVLFFYFFLFFIFILSYFILVTFYFSFSKIYT